MTNHYHELRIISLEVKYGPHEDEVENSERRQRKIGKGVVLVPASTEVSVRESNTQGL
jgi:hypothetical protein